MLINGVYPGHTESSISNQEPAVCMQLDISVLTNRQRIITYPDLVPELNCSARYIRCIRYLM